MMRKLKKMGISKFMHFYFLSNFYAVVWIIIIKISLVRIIGTHKLNTNLQTKTCKICWTTHCRAVAFLIWDYFHTDKKMLQLSISRNGSHIGSRTVLLDTILKVSHLKNHLSPSWRNSFWKDFNLIYLSK